MFNREKRIVISDSHEVIRMGIRYLLSTTTDFCVAGEVSCGLSAYSACNSLKPDVVLTELTLPGMDGVDMIQRLKKRWPELKIIVLTADEREYRAHAAVEAGAQAIIFKSSPESVLLRALRSSEESKAIFLDPALSHAHVTGNEAASPSRLTTRERQILKLITEERRNRDIADALRISIKTVETHRLNLMRKLDAHCAVGLVKWAQRLGIH